MIRLVLTDVDGVLTDGKFVVGEKAGNISKQLCFKDLDAVSGLRQRGYKVGVLTGEEDFFTEYIFSRIKPDYFVPGCKDKKSAMQKIAREEGCSLKEICYVGDGRYDIEALESAGLGVCPKDAIDEAKKVSVVVLERSGGEGCLAEVLTYLDSGVCGKPGGNRDKADCLSIFREHRDLADELVRDKELQEAVERAVEIIARALRNSCQVLFCGNGGSAADAQHLSTELVSRFYMERKALNAEALTVNSSAVTAIGNDYSFSRVFSRQVEAKGHAGDVLVGITTSGASKNVLEALKTAKSKGMETIVFTGQCVSALERLADVIISVPSRAVPRIQEMHIMIGHVVCEFVEKSICG